MWPMNKPAHLVGLHNGATPVRADRVTFLQPLPAEQAAAYLAELNDCAAAQRTRVPDGQHLRVLLWLRDAVEAFRQSTPPSREKELHVNIHESIFPEDVLPDKEPEPDYGLGTAALRVIGAWWRLATTPEERAM